MGQIVWEWDGVMANKLNEKMPSEQNMPEAGWWDRNDSSDLFGHFSPYEYSARWCRDCGGRVDAEMNADISKDGRLGRLRRVFRCPDCGRSARRLSCGYGWFLSPGLIDPDDEPGE